MEIDVKQIKVARIDSTHANAFIRKHHYSGKVVPNSQLHFGAFYMDKLHGVMSFGASINKKGTINLVKGTAWNGFIELNRMAFDSFLPRNSESRAISVALRLIKKHAPHIKWVISFADGTQCGDGTIYRASGFKLVGIAPNQSLRVNPVTGEKVHIIQAHHLKIPGSVFRTWQPLIGYQLKYIYFLDKAAEGNLTAPMLPFSAIDEAGAGMYLGSKITLAQRQAREA